MTIWIKRSVQFIYGAVVPTALKEWVKRKAELRYWQAQSRKEGTLGHDHYVRFYTTQFGLTTDDYRDKRVLDVGCGPRGSLEWANMTTERVGLDPLANEYLRLGANKHKMRYVAAPSETMPFPDEYFDIVCSFNSLDHVRDLYQTIREITRVTKRGGLLLLIVEANHPPTPTETITLHWNVSQAFTGFRCDAIAKYEIGNHDIYAQLARDARFDETNPTDRPGIVAARFVRV